MAAPALSGLIRGKLEQKARRSGARASPGVLGGLSSWRRLKRPKMCAEALKKLSVLPPALQARDLFNSLQLDLLLKLTVAPVRLNIAVMNHLHGAKCCQL